MPVDALVPTRTLPEPAIDTFLYGLQEMPAHLKKIHSARKILVKCVVTKAWTGLIIFLCNHESESNLPM